MNHALTFVLQMDWVSNNQYNENWSKYRYFFNITNNTLHIEG